MTTEREQATKIANDWLDFKMNLLTQLVPGDPDCDACVLARQCIRAIETADYLRKALEKSIWFQSHYAGLLNQYDGGKRMTFETADQWIDRLHELEPVPQTAS